MTVSARILFGMCLLCASATAAAADANKSACVEREMNEGHDARTSEAICGIKRFFQNRIRSKPDEEPVEMTVGAPPMISDDTDTPGAGNLEINSVFDAELSRDRQKYEAPLLDINYGIGDRLQLRYEVPFVIDRNSPAGGPDRTDHGVGDSAVGLKYRFYDDDENGLSLGVYPQVRFHTPAAARAVSEGGTTVILPLLLTGEFSHASITANLGVEKSSQAGGPDYFASFGTGTRLNAKIALMAEIAAQDLRHVQQLRVIFDLGFKVKLGQKQSIMAALGHDLRSPDGESSNSYVRSTGELAQE
jgi:Putative MetA-pathway of phenol degradation